MLPCHMSSALYSVFLLNVQQSQCQDNVCGTHSALCVQLPSLSKDELLAVLGTKAEIISRFCHPDLSTAYALLSMSTRECVG